MSELSKKVEANKTDLKTDGGLLKGDVVQQNDARASKTERKPKLFESEIPIKKRKTRRGKSKRKQPYMKYGRKYNKIIKNKIIKPEAPHNSNQFLIEDHGIIDQLDENLKCVDQVSTSTLTRTRDSSFSIDSDGEFYSSPDDEEQFLMKDFNDQYQSIQAEQLQTMSKSELIEEYILLENRYQQEQILRSTQKQKDLDNGDTETVTKLQKEIDKLRTENEHLQRENEILRNKLSTGCNSDSEDSETDSSDSCSSSSRSSSSSSCGANSASKTPTPVLENAIEFNETNGQTSPHCSVDPV